jgi:NADH-quinone oxidoreductase subunit N
MTFAYADFQDAVTKANVHEQFPRLVETIKGDVSAIWPEIILSVGTCVVILADVFAARSRPKVIGLLALATIVAAGIAVMAQGAPATASSHFAGMMVLDGFGHFFKLLLLAGSAICVPMVMSHTAFNQRRMGEFYGLFLGAIVGMFLMVTAKNLLMMYLGIEFASITCYLATAYQKEDRAASEGGMKYVIYGSVASGLMIYGLSWIYGMTGTLDIVQISRVLQVDGVGSATMIIAGLLAFGGFAYKMSAFPMHFWCPDVYQGAALPFTAFLSVVSKSAGFAVFIRFLFAFLGDGSWTLPVAAGDAVFVNWPQILAVIAALTMSIGNLAALFQTNLKRLLAYSSIAHAGYLVMGLVAVRPTLLGAGGGWEAVGFYLLAYLLTNLGAFMVAALAIRETGNESIDAFRGLGARSPVLAASFLILLVSLIGIPPTAGFIGKWQLLQAALQGGYVWLAVLAAVNTAVSAWYYLRLVKLMYLDSAAESRRFVLPAFERGFVVLLVALVLYFFIFPGSAVDYIGGLVVSIG